MGARRISLLPALLMAVAAHAGEEHVVEELTFRVAPADHVEFLRHDREIWTDVLSRQPGYLGKETWLASRPKNEIKLVIRWRSRKDWNSVPKDLLRATDERFRSAMGEAPYKMLSGRAFRVLDEGESGRGVPIGAVLSAERVRLARVVEVARDPVYHGPKRYLGIPLSQALQPLATGLSEAERARADVVFDCGDDYHSTVPLRRALQGDGWIAFRDLAAADGRAWTEPRRGPSPAKMGRAYVVWTGLDEPLSVTWPYGIRRIRLVVRPE